MSATPSFEVTLELLENYTFKADFGDFGYIVTDEPAPLGKGEGPNPSRLVAAAAANCLAASLLFALRKKQQNPTGVVARVRGELARTDGRWRIGHIDVDLQLADNADALPLLNDVLAQFEDFCIVTQSLRSGIAVNVAVRDGSGKVLHQGS